MCCSGARRQWREEHHRRRGTGARRSACTHGTSCLLPTRVQPRAFGSRLLVSQDLSAAWCWWWHMESGTKTMVWTLPLRRCGAFFCGVCAQLQRGLSTRAFGARHACPSRPVCPEHSPHQRVAARPPLPQERPWRHGGARRRMGRVLSFLCLAHIHARARCISLDGARAPSHAPHPTPSPARPSLQSHSNEPA